MVGAMASSCTCWQLPSAMSFPIDAMCHGVLAIQITKGIRELSSTPRASPMQNRRCLIPCKALEIDQDTLLAVGVGLAGFAVGIGIPVFYDTQVKRSETRTNSQPCFPCKGTGSQTCRFCTGVGNITVDLGEGEKEVSKCVNCDGDGAITCTTCQGSGIQPRYLDRREFKDDD